MCLARKVIGYTVHFLFAFLGGRYIGTFEVGDADIIRFTGKVIIGHHSQLSGKTESHLIFHLFRRQPDGECLGFFLYFAREHFRHSRFLLVQIVKHQLELGAVLGHIVCFAAQEGILNYLLIGHPEEILSIGRSLGHTIAPETVIPAATDEEAAAIAVSLVREGRAGFLQKGLMQTATILKAVVNKQTGIGLGRPMSHVALLELPGYPKLLGVTDGGMIPNPDLEGKKAIAHNAVAMFHGLGYERPLVSAVCAAENVSPKIIETVDAAALKQAALEGAFGPCYVEGPISLDLALSRESAQIKGYESPVTGETDILLVPGMAAGNMMVKSLVLFAGAKMVGVVTGAKCPIALNSRSASFEEKYHSLLVCALMSSSREENAE